MRPRPLRNHSACSRYTYTLSSASSENMNASRHRAAMKRCILSQYRMIDVSSNAYIVLTVQSRMTCPSKQLFTFFHPFNLIGRTHTSRLEPVKLGGLAAAVLPLAFPTRLDSAIMLSYPAVSVLSFSSIPLFHHCLHRSRKPKLFDPSSLYPLRNSSHVFRAVHYCFERPISGFP